MLYEKKTFYQKWIFFNFFCGNSNNMCNFAQNS
jgi:hypothetical protein